MFTEPPSARIEAGLHYPLPGQPRVAVLGLRLRREEGVRCFVPWTCEQLIRAEPEALAGSAGDLLEAARLRQEGLLELPFLRLPLVVISTLKSGVMTSRERELLWQAFGLPFYEQVRDGSGRLLAYECDARNGFHWVGEDAVARVPRSGPCACGRRTAAKRRASGRTESASRATTVR